MEFFVPYHQIKFFTLKEGNVFRHNLSFRLYLYLKHFHSGRIKWNDRKHLVGKFQSSHTAVAKSLSYLKMIGLCKIKNGWVEVVGERKSRSVTLKNIGRNFNAEFEFNLDILLNRKKFTNHLFLSIYQSSAMLRGKQSRTVDGYGNMKKMRRCSPQTKLNSDSVTLKDGQKLNSIDFGSSVNFNGFIQRQSSTYQAKMTNRHPMTSYKRMRSLIKQHNIFDDEAMMYFHHNTNYKEFVKNETGSTEFYSQTEAETFLELNSIQNGWVKETESDTYRIMLQLPFYYSFMIPTKLQFKNFEDVGFKPKPDKVSNHIDEGKQVPFIKEDIPF